MLIVGDELSRWAGVLGAAAVMALMAAGPAQAGLIGAGAAVTANYLYGSPSTSTESQGTAPLATFGTTFSKGAASLSQVTISDTQITINYQGGAQPQSSSMYPYCYSVAQGTSCGDVINGFDFKFTGENIIGVRVDATSDSGMQPVTGTFQGNTHSGLQLLSNNEILVDMTGDLPSANLVSLILDVTTAPIQTPEPASVAVLAVGLLGLAGMRQGWRVKT